MSLFAPPSIVSAPSSPSSRILSPFASSPALKTSSPVSPIRISFSPAPTIVSSPLYPFSVLASLSPVITSLLIVPVIFSISFNVSFSVPSVAVANKFAFTSNKFTLNEVALEE